MDLFIECATISKETSGYAAQSKYVLNLLLAFNKKINK